MMAVGSVSKGKGDGMSGVTDECDVDVAVEVDADAADDECDVDADSASTCCIGMADALHASTFFIMLLPLREDGSSVMLLALG